MDSAVMRLTRQMVAARNSAKARVTEVTALSDPECQEPWELSRAFSASGIGGMVGCRTFECKPEVAAGDGWCTWRARKVPEGCCGTKQM